MPAVARSPGRVLEPWKFHIWGTTMSFVGLLCVHPCDLHPPKPSQSLQPRRRPADQAVAAAFQALTVAAAPTFTVAEAPSQSLQPPKASQSLQPGAPHSRCSCSLADALQALTVAAAPEAVTVAAAPCSPSSRCSCPSQYVAAAPQALTPDPRGWVRIAVRTAVRICLNVLPNVLPKMFCRSL